MDIMLSKALREFTTGPLNQLIVNLGGQDGNQWEEELKKFLRKEPCWISGNVTQVAQWKPASCILELVSTVEVVATTSKFVAKEKFVINTKCNAPVKISAVRDNFTEWFLLDSGKVEDPISKHTLCCHKLRKLSTDGPIIAELGGAKKSRTALSDMFALMEKQGKGEGGVLLNSGWPNVFYIKDSVGELRAVFVRWFDDGWDLDAASVGDQFTLRAGRQVFSRLSVPSSVL